MVLTGSVAEQQYPWIFQLFVHDEYRLDSLADEVEAYARDEVRDSAYTRHWLAALRDHCADIARPGGLFHDDQVTGGPWQGNRRKIHACLFRRRSATQLLKGPDELGPIRDLPGLAELEPPRRARALEMADALSLFCTEGSLEAKLFN
ncbi:uncharacterized protein sS8_0509 [Methylocaldum marinum]|uniref:Uncharacterized protein n=1 Tax=Methylocaldum marinum TaxID=1432792 RepID=A0A250KLN7_9GAMM|nr:uncharacterized protein sS8_0509 [Methylocaldum marinum]